MILSPTHRYVFIELPRTGCTAVREELIAHYDGRPVLTKHDGYEAFLRPATDEERGYFAFSGMRHPMDSVVSRYFKACSDHDRRLPDPAAGRPRRAWREEVEFAAAGGTFTAFFEHFYGPGRRTVVYDDRSASSHGRLDLVLRFEQLQADFAALLDRLGIEQRRPLPWVNRTAGRDGVDWRTCYPPRLQARARFVFGPYMERWGYAFPEGWEDVAVPWTARALFAGQRPVRRFATDRLRRPLRRLRALGVRRGPQ